MQLKSIAVIAVLSLVVASLLVAGCTTSTTSNTNQTPSATPSTNASTTTSATTTAATTTSATTTAATTTSATTTAATTSPTVTPSPSASPTPTPTPSVSGIVTSIQFVRPTVAKGESLGINVISSASGTQICGHGAVTATIGTVSSGGSDCFYTAYLDTSSLNPGTYDVILKFAGDSCYNPSQSTSTITITA